jgi:hypothetical protein
MATLLERLRAARESWVKVGEFEFLIRRPTDVEMLRARGDLPSEFLRRVVIDWRGVREIDLVPGGDPTPAPFDAALLVEWAEDRQQLYVDLVSAVENQIAAHWSAKADAAKK